MIENLIAYHCGPALAGIKPANIVACYKDKIPNVHAEIERLNRQLNCRDIHLERLCECEKRVLLMVYRSQALCSYLQNDEIRALLSAFGYGEQESLKVYLDRLKTRLAEQDFPHEIGAFLGYPAHDIYGFIRHRGAGCPACRRVEGVSGRRFGKKTVSQISCLPPCALKTPVGGQNACTGVLCGLKTKQYDHAT